MVIMALLALGGVFDHEIHAQEGCLRCHPSVETAARLSDVAPPTAELCAECHEDGRAPRPPRLNPPRLRFSHRAHLSRGARCARCHGVRPEPVRPEERRCAECHKDIRSPERCADCHLAGPSGRLITEGPHGRLIPRDHASEGFKINHREAPSCQACHGARDCLACHASKLKPPSIHPLDYLALHASDAQARRMECQACHTPSACVNCHLKAGLTEAPGALTARRQPNAGAFHPPGFVGERGRAPGAGHHRHQARADLHQCVSCHAEDTCLRCHAVNPRASLQVSPHPLDFKGRSRALLNANPRGCLKCHRSILELDRLCGR